MAIDVAVFQNHVAAFWHKRAIRPQLLEHMRLPMIGVKNHKHLPARWNQPFDALNNRRIGRGPSDVGETRMFWTDACRNGPFLRKRRFGIIDIDGHDGSLSEQLT